MATDSFDKFPPASTEVGAPISSDKHSSPGAMLRVAREAAGLSVVDVATRLRMGVRQVDALERADYAALPTGTFLRGMVRNYAKLVHVGGDAAIRVLESTHTHAAVSLKDATIVVPSHNIKLGGARSELANPKVRVAIAGLVLILLGAAFWYWWQYVRPNLSSGGRPVVVTPAADKAELKPEPASSAPPAQSGPETTTAAIPAPLTAETPTLQPSISPPVVQPLIPSPADAAPVKGATPTSAAPQPATAFVTATPTATPTPIITTPIENANSPAKESTNLKSDPNAIVRPAGSSVLGFTFTGESWVEVVDGRGKALVSRRFKAGEVGEAVGRAPFSIVVGNAPQVKMAYNGKDFDLVPHTRVAVARLTLK